MSGGKARPARKADNFNAICKLITYIILGMLDVSQPYKSPRVLPLKLSRS
jgi:hypothetical protein